MPLEQRDFGGGSLVPSAANALLQLQSDFTVSITVAPILLQVPVEQPGLGHGPSPSLVQQAGLMMILRRASTVDSFGSTLSLLLHLPLEQQDFGEDSSSAAATLLLLQVPVAQQADFTALTMVAPILLQVPVEQHGLGHGPSPSLLQQAGLMILRGASKLDSIGSTLLLLLRLLSHRPFLEQQDFGGDSSSCLVTTSGAGATLLLLLLPVTQQADFFTASIMVAPIIVQVPVEQHGLRQGPAPLQQAGFMIRMAAMTRSDSGSNRFVKEKGRGETLKKCTRTPFFLWVPVVVVVVCGNDNVRVPTQVKEP